MCTASSCLGLAVVASTASVALAEAPVAALAKDAGGEGKDHWEFFTTGRIGNFVSWSKGDGMPQATTYDLETGMPRHQVLLGTGGSGFAPSSARFLPKADGTPSNVQVATINSMRLRSGFTGNVVGFGLHREFSPNTKVTAFVSVTSIADSQSQKKYFLNPPDVREGYLKIEGNWGSVLAGRAAVLFNRGAVETDYLYLHGFGLGFPADLNSAAGFPTAGQIGFGVLANGYGAGFVYGSPVVAGVQLSVGLFDPSSLTGSNIERTKYLRPEFELTVDEPLGTLGKVHLYFNGGRQPNYQPNRSDAVVQNLQGVGYGARIEVGRVHVAGGGHRGHGVGLAYPGLPSDAVYDTESRLRDTDGFFVMAQLVLGKFDINWGVGRSVVHMTAVDLTADPNNPFGDPRQSVIQSQTGISGAIVFHARDWLHFDFDVMHADSKWDLGERQRINFYNAGTTITW
jgi:hypothetical protein